VAVRTRHTRLDRYLGHMCCIAPRYD